MQREGPWERIPRGIYQGKTVEWLIRNNPRYFMSCVKEWLDISPTQAKIFKEVSRGGEIPDRYIINDHPYRSREIKDWTERDYLIYYSNRDILPDYDFDPSQAPEWWEEFKRRSAEFTRPSQTVDLYESYVKKDLQKSLKMVCRDTR